MAYSIFNDGIGFIFFILLSIFFHLSTACYVKIRYNFIAEFIKNSLLCSEIRYNLAQNYF